jgi:hypothetical protein
LKCFKKTKKRKEILKKLKMNTIKDYTNRLILLQVISSVLLLFINCLQGIAIFTSNWFVLNINDDFPTAKGGLWNYCYIESPTTGAIEGEFYYYKCIKYEELPNYFVFINNRLYDSRVMLICSFSFGILLMVIETLGIVILLFFNNKKRQQNLIDYLKRRVSTSASIKGFYYFKFF